MQIDQDEPTSERLRRDRKFQNPLKWLGLLMAAFFVALGAWIYFSRSLGGGLPADSRNLLSGLLVVYGIYRGWRAWSMYFQE